MSSHPFDLDPASVQEQQAFLRRLALRLARDEETAEDLVQQTWLKALEQPRSPAGLRRGWFARVLRNLAINRSIGEERRRERERSVARTECVETIGRVDGRLEHQALVLEAVRRLPEVLRAVVFLRYFDRLSPSEIARQTGAPLPTVKSRLARARAELRSDLDRSFGGDRGAWLTVVVPSLTTDVASRVAPGGPVASLGLGTLTMSTTWKALGVLTAVVGGLLVWRTQGNDTDDLAVQPMNPNTTEEHRAVAESAPVPARSGRRAAAANSTDRVETTPPAASESTEPIELVRGRLVGPNVEPLGARHVALLGRDQTAQTASDGSFALPLPSVTSEVGTTDEDLVTLLAARAGPQVTRELIVVAAPRARFSGTVVDELGRPLTDADVSVVLPDGFQRRFPYIMDDSIVRTASTRTTADGEFAILDGMRVEGGVLEARLAGYVPLRVPLARVGPDERLVLRRPDSPTELLSGLVVDDKGRPSSGAQVSFGGEVTTSDEQGEFKLLRGSAERGYDRLREALQEESATLRAVKVGFLPAELQVELAPDTGAPRWPDGVLLELGAPALETIAGHVVDPRGAPLPEVRVFLAEATLFSMAGSSSSIENLLGGDPTERITTFVTDETGRFEVGGLIAESYHLVAFHWTSAVQVRTEAIASGRRDVEIVLDPGDRWSSVSGRVITPRGEPIGGAEVHLFTDATNFMFQGRFVRTTNWRVRGTTSDDQGNFVLYDVPREHVYLMVMGTDVSATNFALAEERNEREQDALTEVEIVVPRRVHVQVELQDPNEADQVGFLDALGDPVEMRVYRGKPGPPALRMPVDNGSTGVLSVVETAETLLYFKDDEVVRRRSVTLLFGELNEL